jgi:hypothetical protein
LAEKRWELKVFNIFFYLSKGQAIKLRAHIFVHRIDRLVLIEVLSILLLEDSPLFILDNVYCQEVAPYLDSKVI